MKFKGSTVKFSEKTAKHQLTGREKEFQLVDIKEGRAFHKCSVLILQDGTEILCETIEPVSSFEEIWEMQYALNKHTLKKNNQDDYDEITGKTPPIPNNELAKEAHRKLQNKWVKNYNLAMRQECAELLDSTDWKWWRTKKDLFDKQNVNVELIDILHFWMSACQVMGLTPDDVYRMYKTKNQVNYDRQKSGYVEKNENDSKHVK